MTTLSSIDRRLVLYGIILLPLCSTLHHGYWSLQYGYRLEGRLINSYTGYSIVDCVQECLRTTRCQSVNYHRGANFCEINYNSMASEERYAAFNNIDSTDRDINRAGWIYSDKDNWDKDLIWPCSVSGCSVNAKCTTNALGKLNCIVSDCGFPRGVDTDKVDHWSAIGIHRQMPPSCARGYTQMGSGLMKCQTDGEWTNNVRCVAYGEYDGHSYLLVPDAVSWVTAKERCERYGGYLAEVESIEENNWITQTLVAPYYANSSADWWLLSSWIGANDLTEEGTFVWSTSGNRLNYTNWLSGQPDNFLGNENCVQVTNNGIWNDMGCGLPIPFLCKATAFLMKRLF